MTKPEKIIPLRKFKKFIDEGGDRTKALVTKDFTSVSVDYDNRTVSFVASTDAIDRHDDQVMQDGWYLDAYRANPVILWNHESENPPIGKGEVAVIDGKLIITISFIPASNPWVGDKAEGVFQMVCNGYLSAVSVGFIIKDFDIPDDAERYGIIVTQAELFEVSVVPVPANREALVIPESIPTETGESFGENTGEPEELDTQETAFDGESARLKRLWRIQASL